MVFWSPAVERPGLWRTLLGLIIIAASFFGATFGIILLGERLLGIEPFAIVNSNSPMAMTVMFLTFLGAYVGLGIALPLLHRRSPVTLFGPDRRLNMRHFWFGVAVTGAIAVLLYVFQLAELLVIPEEERATISSLRPLSEWALWLLPALVLILIQSLGEELVFRGYLLQQLRARFANVLVWAVLPSLLFGLLHFDAGTYGLVNGAMYVMSTTVSGTIACLVTLRTGNLGAAAGLHFGNNASLVFLGTQGNMDGFSLFGVEMAPMSGYVTYSMALQTVIIIAAYLFWRRWMNKLQPIANLGAGD